MYESCADERLVKWTEAGLMNRLLTQAPAGDSCAGNNIPSREEAKPLEKSTRHIKSSMY